MKIGVLTFHGAHNYGSVLQAYATCRLLSKWGHDVQIINLRNQAQKDAYRILKPIQSISSIPHRFFTLIIYPQLKTRFNHFERFINKVLPITEIEFRNSAQLRDCIFDFDAFITGSDQVWNPSCQDFESAYFLDFVSKEKLRIAYAPSLGKADMTSDNKYMIKNLLTNIDFVSCREIEGPKILRGLTDKPVTHVCDPVLTLKQDEWAKLADRQTDIKEPYILTYFLNNNHGDRNPVLKISHLLGYRIIALNEYIRDYANPAISHRINSSPEQFLALVRNAAFVITNSFHATAFSVIFKKPFYTMIAANQNVPNNNDSRKVDFLKLLGLESRLVPNKLNITHVDTNIDWESSYEKLNRFREKSLNYLQIALQGK